MPSRDPRENPLMETARPADLSGSEVRLVLDPWEAVLGDRAWHPVTVRAWFLCSGGRYAVMLEWGAGTWNETYWYDKALMRERTAAPASWRPPS